MGCLPIYFCVGEYFCCFQIFSYCNKTCINIHVRVFECTHDFSFLCKFWSSKRKVNRDKRWQDADNCWVLDAEDMHFSCIVLGNFLYFYNWKNFRVFLEQMFWMSSKVVHERGGRGKHYKEGWELRFSNTKIEMRKSPGPLQNTPLDSLHLSSHSVYPFLSFQEPKVS